MCIVSQSGAMDESTKAEVGTESELMRQATTTGASASALSETGDVLFLFLSLALTITFTCLLQLIITKLH